jgi:hypothetical protein
VHTREFERSRLVRQGHVGTSCARGEEGAHIGDECVRRRVDRDVFQRDAALRGKQRMQPRRQRMRDGMAEHGVATNGAHR